MTCLPGSRRCFSYRLAAGLLVLLLGTAAPASAHELHHRLSRTEAVTLQFYHPGDNHPVFEPYAVFAPESDTPFQTGRLNGSGELTFRPGKAGEWRVRVATGEGHGTEIRIHIDEDGKAVWQEGRLSSRMERILAALGYLFGMFGFLAIWRVRASRPRRS